MRGKREAWDAQDAWEKDWKERCWDAQEKECKERWDAPKSEALGKRTQLRVTALDQRAHATHLERVYQPR